MTTEKAPLSGFRVLDLGRFIAGPWATELLSDFGAEVIKVERPPHGEDARHYGQSKIGDQHFSAVFASLNCEKLSISLDMTSESGRGVFYRLVESADALVHNFRPGVAERLKIDYKTVSEINSRLVYCSISGFGDVGPLKNKGGNDLVAQAYSGLMSISGEPGRNPVRCPVAIADFSAGFNAAIATLVGLLQRERTGRGCEVSTSLLESMFGVLSYHLTEYLVTKQVPQPMGSGNRLGQPNQAFATRDGWVVISAVNDAMWTRCSQALGIEAAASDPRFSSLAQRYANNEELIAMVAEATAKLSTAACIESLETNRVTCAPIHRFDELPSNEQIQALDQLQMVDYLGLEIPIAGNAIRIDTVRRPIRKHVPTFGQHSDQILHDLGYGAADIRKLKSARTVL